MTPCKLNVTTTKLQNVNLNFISFNCNTFVSSSLYSCCSNDVLRLRKYFFIRDKSNSNRNIKLKHIDVTSSNLVTTFNNPSPLKNKTRSTLYDGSRLPDKIKSISPVVTTTVNFISVSPKI